MFQGVGNFGLWILDFSPRLRDTLTRGLGKRLLTPSPDAGRGKVAKNAKFRLWPRRGSGRVGVDAEQVLSRAENLGRYGESGLRGVAKPIASPVANIADR